MAKRQSYGNGKWSITGLRDWAKRLRENGYPIVGAAKMEGEALLAACNARSSDMRRDREARNLRPLMGREFVPGTWLSAECGCKIVATSGILQWTEGPFDDGDHPLYVEGQYVRLCGSCARENPAGIDRLNDSARGEGGYRPYRFPLHSHTVIDSLESVETVEHGDLCEGDIVHVYGMRVRLDGPVKRYPRGNFEGDDVPCSSWEAIIIGGTHPYGWSRRQWTVQSIDRGVWRVRERRPA